MAEETGIGWCDGTINFWYGCNKVSPGCKFCYMFRDRQKFGQDGTDVRKTSLKTVERILKNLHVQRIERELSGNKEPLKIFTCSWSDFFLEAADPWRKEAWDMIRANPEFIWIILTKRIDRAKDCFPEDWGEGWPNVWLGVSAENQQYWNERVDVLLQTPAAVRVVSAEPLLSEIDIKVSPLGFQNKIDWVIVGGESGNDTGNWLFRRCQTSWIGWIVDDCKELGIAVFVKQLGTYISKQLQLKDRSGSKLEEWPEHLDSLKIQEFPVKK